MTTTTEMKKIKITLSDASPVSVDPAQWPVIASAKRHDGKVECQARAEWEINVREHTDGRRVVYGSLAAGNGGQYAGFRGVEAGYLLATGDDTVRAIRRVAGAIGDDQLGAECIADLPAVDVDAASVVAEVRS